MSIVRSSALSLATKGIETVLNLALLAILARMLEPKDFGIFAIILATQALLQPLVDMGLAPAYIKAKQPTRELKNSFFTLNIALGFFNFVVLLIAAPLVSSVYTEEILLPLIVVFSISVLFNSVSRQSYAQLMRDKRFDALLVVSLVSNFFTFLIAVYFAFQELGVWVLVIKAIALSIMTAVIIFYFAKPNYQLVKWQTIKKFTVELKFGAEIFVNRVLNGIFNAGDKFIFGKLYGTELLGHYSNAQQLSRMADTHIRTPITAAVYSHLERLEPEYKKNIYDNFASIIFLITFMFSGLLFLEGELIVNVLLGEKWDFAAEYIKWLALFGVGMVFKGLFTIISMSDNTVRYLNKVILLFILLASVLVLSFYFLELKAIEYLKFLALFVLVFWFYFLIKQLNNNGSSFGLFTSVGFSFIFLTFLFYVKQELWSSLWVAFIFLSTLAIYLMKLLVWHIKK